jgi:hypothetical protein
MPDCADTGVEHPPISFSPRKLDVLEFGARGSTAVRSPIDFSSPHSITQVIDPDTQLFPSVSALTWSQSQSKD